MLQRWTSAQSIARAASSKHAKARFCASDTLGVEVRVAFRRRPLASKWRKWTIAARSWRTARRFNARERAPDRSAEGEVPRLHPHPWQTVAATETRRLYHVSVASGPARHAGRSARNVRQSGGMMRTHRHTARCDAPDHMRGLRKCKEHWSSAFSEAVRRPAVLVGSAARLPRQRLRAPSFAHLSRSAPRRALAPARLDPLARMPLPVRLGEKHLLHGHVLPVESQPRSCARP